MRICVKKKGKRKGYCYTKPGKRKGSAASKPGGRSARRCRSKHSGRFIKCR